jgi:polyadenylation factor subunit 2
MQTWPL